MATALASLMSVPSIPLAPHVTPIDELARLRAALGPSCPRLFMKRDDLLSFAMGGNKVRKMQTVAAEALAAKADVLITCGGVQSNHARVTAATGAALGMGVVLVLNGTPPDRPTANTLLDHVFGADIRYVASRDERAPMMAAVAAEFESAGRRPFVVPLGASNATGAIGFARGVMEIASAGLRPDLIVASTSSGGTQAGLVAGAALVGLRARILGVSADDLSARLVEVVRDLLRQMAGRLGGKPATLGADGDIEVDDSFVGDGYGIPTPASIEAQELVARREGIVLDPVYTAKAMAGLIDRIRRGEFQSNQSVLFWHTGGLGAFS